MGFIHSCSHTQVRHDRSLSCELSFFVVVHISGLCPALAAQRVALGGAPPFQPRPSHSPKDSLIIGFRSAITEYVGSKYLFLSPALLILCPSLKGLDLYGRLA